MVTKFNGDSAERDDCHFINGEWYEKNVDCFKVRGKWVPLSNDIYFDYSTGKYESKYRSYPHYGYVDKDKKGFFTSTSAVARILTRNGEEVALNHDAAVQNGYIPSRNCNYYKEEEDQITINDSYREPVYNAYLKFKSSVRNYQKHNKSKPSINLLKLRNLLHYTFGVEFETSDGFIQKNRLAELGFIPLIDGSLRVGGDIYSYEYTSIPLEGPKGLQTIVDFCGVLKNNCLFDKKCSFHVHLGGFKPTRKNVVVLYTLLTKIQHEVYELFPFCKYDSTIINKKNYCQPLPTDVLYPKDYKNYKDYIDKVYTSIFRFVSCGFEPDPEINSRLDHHPKADKKWDIPSRYYWVSLVSLLFSPSRTVEFRIHTPTFSEYKVIHWILICNAILKYAENEGIKLLDKKVELKDVLTVYKGWQGKKVQNTLNEYIQHRKDNFMFSPIEDMSEFSVKKDKKFEFKGIL